MVVGSRVTRPLPGQRGYGALVLSFAPDDGSQSGDQWHPLPSGARLRRMRGETGRRIHAKHVPRPSLSRCHPLWELDHTCLEGLRASIRQTTQWSSPAVMLSAAGHSSGPLVTKQERSYRR